MKFTALLLAAVVVVGALAGGVDAAQPSPVGVAGPRSNGYGPAKEHNFSGYVGVPDGSGNPTERELFYWFFESRSAPATDPLIVWLTGGPGCSSMLALLTENGPYKLSEQNELEINPNSWNTNANAIWIDQPVGTGYSYGSKFLDPGVNGEAQVAADLYAFLQGFLAANPKYAKAPFYITGESYAGHYIPAFGGHVNRMNAQVPQGAIHINLQGIAIGNGLVDPYYQYQEYANYAESMRLVTASEAAEMSKGVAPCVALIKQCETGQKSKSECLEALESCNLSEMLPFQSTGLNVYDVRVKCQIPPLCYNFTGAGEFLNSAPVKTALGVPQSKKWQSCNRGAALGLTLGGDWMRNFATDIPQMLANNITVLVYSGEDDFICNWYGGHKWTQNLQWPGQQAFQNAPNTTWHVNGQMAGTSVSAEGFTFLRVKDAGHMVPLNQPVNALNMLQRLFKNAPFN